MHKNIGVFFRDPNPIGYPFDTSSYETAYQELDTELRKIDAELYIVRSNNTYLGNSRFSKSWQFQRNKIIESGPITLDKLYIKGHFISDNTVPTLNNQKLDYICNVNKYETYKLFKQFSPKTLLAKNLAELEVALNSLPEKIKVVKPIDGSGGIGVFIDTDSVLLKQEHIFPVLAQEFIDTSDGILGICKGTHDLRVVIVNGKISFAYIRTPRIGSLLSNLAQGGTLIEVQLDKLPDAIIEAVNYVDANMSQYGERVYSIDFGFSKNGVKLFELNSQVGLSPNNKYPSAKKFKQQLAKVLTQ
ncbi:MAG: ATP-grasp domain-containing protein [bacterium]|nr:ATP-grasp domain-containing protein [bacterium]